MKIKELLALYHEFCHKMENLGNPHLDVSIMNIKPSTLEQITSFENKYQLQIPEDIQYFWQHYEKELSASPENYEEDGFFNAGIDFLNLTYIERDMPNDRKQAKEYENESSFALEIRLHAEGIGLSYSEPRIFCDLGGNGAIYFVVYDGDTPKEPIADHFNEFFEHYLASGCFCSHRFDLYWEYVKDLVPIKIPLKENKWIRFYSKVYQKQYDQL